MISTLIFAAACILLGIWFLEIIPFAKWAKVATGILWIASGILTII